VKKVNVLSRLVMVFSFCVMSMTFSILQASAETNECTASYDSQSNTLHVPCFNLDNQSFWLDLGLISGDPIQLQLNNYGANGGAVCLDDDVQNGIYRICNYFPLAKGNHWRYTTGDYTIMNETRTCSSGYSGVRYGTTTYEFEPFIAVNEEGFIFAGCQYDEGILEDWGISIVFIGPQMQIGETVSTSIPPGIISQYETTFDTILVGIETITVPAGTFNTLKFEILVNDIGKCSYKTTLWFGKGIGLVKIARTNANPANCLGCMFVCDPNDDVTTLNTPAELVLAVIDGNAIP
jgi:hypothetical protein